MPTALVEAMASRTPIIATATGGVARALGDGEFGAVSRPGDPSALADAVAHLLEDPAGAGLRAEGAASAASHNAGTPWRSKPHGVYTRVLARSGEAGAAGLRTQG